MTEKLPAAEPTDQPDPFAEVAASLYRVADDFVTLTGSGLPKPSVSLSIQLGSRDGDDALTVRSVDAVSSALLGHPGQVQLMSGGVYHYNNGNSAERAGAVDIRVLYSVSTGFAEKRHAVDELARREAELERLRIEVAELRAAQASRKPLVSDETIAAAGRMGSWNEREGRWDDPSGLAYSREPESTVVAPVPAGVEGHPEGRAAAVAEVRCFDADPHLPHPTRFAPEMGIANGRCPGVPELPVHLDAERALTACRLGIIDLPAGHGWTNDHAAVTCKACIDEAPF